MALQLYSVEISRKVLVLAESSDDAEEIADDWEREVNDNDPLVIAVPMYALPPGWNGSEVPYGRAEDNPEEKRVRDLIAEGYAPKLSKPKQPNPAPVEPKR